MRTHILAVLKSLALGIAFIALFTLNQGAARADEVTITGSTTGVVTGTTNLTFAGHGFTGTTALGIGALSGANNLGNFTLNTGSLQSVSGSFTLNITFSVPSGINGGQATSYTASFTGTISPVVNQGGVNVHFANPTQTFTFDNGTNAGSFTLTVNDVFVQNGRSAGLQAGFTGSQHPVPEPATLFLLGSGLSGLAAAARRKRKAAKDKTDS